MRNLVFIALVLLHGTACAQAFKPYPNPKITRAQWQAYFDEVKAKHGPSMQVLFADRLILFTSKQTGTTYAFTEQDHPAYPAWVALTTVNANGQQRILQTGYYAGNQRAFTALFSAYRRNIEKRLEEARPRQDPSQQPSDEPSPDPERRAE